MDQELHTELVELHKKISVVIARTNGLPAALSKLDARVTELEEHRKKFKWTLAGAGGAMTACWTVVLFIIREILK